jgi:ketosteroid isomerase-like protein
MSDEDVIRAATDAWNEGGVDAFLAHVSPGIEWRHPPGFPQGDLWCGRDELSRELHDQFDELFDSGTVELKSMERMPGGWLIGMHHEVRAQSSGLELEWNAWHVWTIEDGLVTKSLVFLNRDAAAKAADVS